MKIKIVIGLCVFLVVLALVGCGHKSSDEPLISTSTPTTPAAATTGVLKISTSGPQSTIGSLDIMVSLPSGVTVDADTTGETAAGAVTVSGAAAGSNTLAVAKFITAGGGAPPQLHIGLVNAAGFGLGECATVNFKVDTADKMPSSKTAFSVTLTTVSDVHGNALGGISAEPLSLATGT